MWCTHTYVDSSQFVILHCSHEFKDVFVCLLYILWMKMCLKFEMRRREEFWKELMKIFLFLKCNHFSSAFGRLRLWTEQVRDRGYCVRVHFYTCYGDRSGEENVPCCDSVSTPSSTSSDCESQSANSLGPGTDGSLSRPRCKKFPASGGIYSYSQPVDTDSVRCVHGRTARVRLPLPTGWGVAKDGRWTGGDGIVKYSSTVS